MSLEEKKDDDKICTPCKDKMKEERNLKRKRDTDRNGVELDKNSRKHNCNSCKQSLTRDKFTEKQMSSRNKICIRCENKPKKNFNDEAH